MAHENVAVSMAYGYTMLTNRIQALMAHVGLGTANAFCGLFNASRANIPMLFAAGSTPWTEAGVPGGRDNYINWAQERGRGKIRRRAGLMPLRARGAMPAEGTKALPRTPTSQRTEPGIVWGP